MSENGVIEEAKNC